jgi:hypothetical protein
LGGVDRAIALWHLSEDDTIRRFEPRANPGHDSAEPLVWAIDEAHAPAYWFPRDCPRGTFWAGEATSDDDVSRFLLGDRSLRVHAVQSDWLGEIRATRLTAYRLPSDTFERYERANGYWVSRQAVAPVEVVELDDLLDRHATSGIELRIVPDLRSVWEQVIGSTLEFSGIRLRNLRR